MKTMKIEKQLLFVKPIKKLRDLQVEEGLHYQNEPDGIRAIGPLFIRGQYEEEDGELQNFQEVLDMDIMAPTHKLSNQSFHIEVENFRAEPKREMLQLYITMAIHGIKEETVQGELQHIAALPPIEEEKVSSKVMEAETAPVLKEIDPVEEETITPASTEETTADVDSFQEFEDLFEDAGTTYTSYRMIVAQPQDTYGSIARRYEVEEVKLRETNHDKDIQPKTLVILP